MFTKNTILYILPEILNIFLKFFTGLIVAKLLGPENLGITAIVGLIYAYSILLQFGVIDGMFLKVYSLNRNNRSYNRLRHIYISASYFFVNSILFIVSIILVLILHVFYTFDYIVWIGIYTNIFVSFLYQYFQFSQSFARFDYNFKSLSIVQVFDYIVKAIFTIVLVYFYGLVGFFIALFLGYLISVLFAKKIINPKYKFIISKKITKEMLILGFPLLLIGAVLTLFQSVDRWFIINSLGSKELGYFTIMFTFSSMILLVPIKILSIVIQYVREYYMKTKDIVSIRLGFIDLLFLFIVLNTVLIIVTKEIVFYLYKYYLTSYQMSYEIINPMMTVSYFIGIFHILSSYFVVIDKVKFTLIAVSISLIFAIIFNFIAIYYYNTLYSVALATFCSGGLLSIIIVYFYVGKNMQFRVLFHLGIVSVVIFLVFIFMPEHNFISSVMDEMVITLEAICVIFLVIALATLYVKNINMNNLRKILER